MSLRQVIVSGIVIVSVLAGCGGRADVAVTTVPGENEDSGFSARQTELAGDAATRSAANPTPTRTVPPTPRPTATTLPSATPGPTVVASASTTEATATGEETPGSVVGPPLTPTPGPTEADIDLVVIAGCEDDSLAVPIRDDEIAGNLAQWRALGDASQAIFAAWDDFIEVVGEFFAYSQVVNNTAVFEGAATFEAVAGEQLPELTDVPDDSPFYDLAQTVIGLTEDQVVVAQLLTRAGTEQDPTYWDEALEIAETFEDQGREVAEQFESACEYWVTVSGE